MRSEQLVSPYQLHRFESKHSGSSRIWAEDGKTGTCVVFPQSTFPDFDLQFRRHDLRILDQAPTVTELANHTGGVVVMESDPGAGDSSTTRAYWEAQSGSHALGALFPSQKPGISEYETLIGLLFPKEMKYRGEMSSEVVDPWLSVLADTRAWMVSRVLSKREQQVTLDRILSPRKGPVTLAIYGLGDIGSYVAQTLYAAGREQTGIRDLLLVSGSYDTTRALETELMDIRHLDRQYPRVYSISHEDIRDLREADVILFLASGYIPPANADSLKVDVRAVQHGINAQIVRDLVSEVQSYGSDITLLMASDPVEQLTYYAALQAASVNRNNQRFAGFGTAINYSRALNQAKAMGIDPSLVDVFGVHGKSMIALIFDKLANMDLAEKLSLSTSLRNYVIRGFNRKPWRAPAQMMVDALITMFTTGKTYASPFLPSVDGVNPGAYFGTKVVHDLGRGTWKPVIYRDYHPRYRDIIARVQELDSLTSQRPDLLHTDVLEGSVDPNTAIHPAFHQEAFHKWYTTADRAARDMNGPYQELADFSEAVVSDILRGIVESDPVRVSEAKTALRERIGITIKREEGLLDEKVRLLTEGFLGGEVLSGIEFSNLHTVADMIYRLLHEREEKQKELMYDVFTKREPPFAVRTRDESLYEIPVTVKLKDGELIQLKSQKELEHYLQSIKNTELEHFPLEALKHPHLEVRQIAWSALVWNFNNLPVSPELFKKIMTLCHFGDDLTLYQWTGDSGRDKNNIVFYYIGQIHALHNLSQNIERSQLRNTDQTIILGTTGAPVGRHHLDVLRSGMEAVRQRYSQGRIEGYISIDNFSRTKAERLLSGEIPALALRRRVAFLQAVNDVNIHLMFPAIPIWFDAENIYLADQIRREVPAGVKIWRLIGGDQLFGYPQAPVYQNIPHVVDMRSQDRQVMDAQLNHLNFREVVLNDSHHQGSSTSIRQSLAGNSLPEDLCPLALAFIKHYGIFTEVTK